MAWGRDAPPIPENSRSSQTSLLREALAVLVLIGVTCIARVSSIEGWIEEPSSLLSRLEDLPNRNFALRPVGGVDLKIGLGVAWNKEAPTASRDDIIDIARSLERPGR